MYPVSTYFHSLFRLPVISGRHSTPQPAGFPRHGRVLFLLLASLASGASHAVGGTIFIDRPPEQGYTLSVGPSLWMYQAYQGGKKTDMVLFPGVDLYFANGAFVSTDNGIGWNLSKRDDLQFGPRLWGQLKRKASASPRLAGTTDIGARLEKGGFLNYAPYEFLLLQSSVRYGSGVKGDGLLGEVGVTVGAPLGSDGTLALTLGSTWANQAYRQSYFGLDEGAAQRSNRSPWQVQSGLQDTSVALSGEYHLDPDWRLSGQWIRARLQGDAARSPVTESVTQNLVSLTLWRRFK